MPPCHPFRPVPGQCGPRRRGPLPAPPFDPRDYWATRKCVSQLSASLGTKLDKVDVVDPGAATEAGKAADAKSTYEELNRVFAKLAKKADSATTLAGYGITDAATKAELAAKADLVDGKVPAAQLPSYVDDVLEYDTMSAFPATGESGKIYVAKDANKTYRWSGTQYVEISPSPVLDDTVTGESANGVKSSGIWSWVKSLLPHWLTSDYTEPATVESVATKADKTALDDKRDNDDLAVYEKVGVGDDWVWTSDDPDLLNALETNGIKPKRVDDDTVGYHFWYTSSDFGDWSHAGEWDPGYGVDAHIVKFKYDSPRLEKFNVTATATRSYKLDPVSPADSLAKVSQLADKIGKDGGTVGYIGDDYSKVFSGLDLLKFVDDFSGEGKTLREILSGFIRTGNELEYVNDTKYGDLSVVGNIYTPIWSSLISGDGRSLPGYLDSLTWRTTGNRTLSDYGITDAAPLSMISETDPTFSDAVLAVGLNIDTNSVAVLNEIADTFGGFPIEGTATTVGGLLAALAAAVAWLKKNKVGSFASVGGASATVENGVAKLSDFFTESNSLLNGRLAYSRNATGLKDRAFNTLSFDGTEYNLSTALAAVTPTASGQPRDLLIVATATAATTISFTAGTIKGDKPTIDGSGTWLITLTEYASGVWYCRQIKMEDAA